MASDNLSPEDVRHILKSNRSEIVSVISKNIGSLFDYLIEDDAISTPVCDRINAEKIPQDRARELLGHVASIGGKAFLSLKRGLKETKCDSLLEAIEVEEEKRKKKKIAEKRNLRPKFFCPTPTPSNPPKMSSTVKSLATLFEGPGTSAHSCGESKSFKGAEHVHRKSTFGASVAGSSITCNVSSDHSEDDVFGETTVKQVADNLNHLNLGLDACSNIPQIKSAHMLLVGCKGNGKSSTGNSILGEKWFMTKRRGGTSKASLGSGFLQGQYEDIQWDIKVADTPGISQEMSKSEFEEIVGGVEMLSDEGCSKNMATPQRACTPGLDAIVLIWSYDHSDRNVEGEVLAFQSLHRLFGDALYKYLVIVVTHASSIEDYIEELPEPLREIERKCSGGLLTFENNASNLEEIQKSREQLFNIVNSLSNGNRHRYTVADLSPMCVIPKGSEIRLALMGKTGVGKSSTGNSIIGFEKFTIACAAASETSICPYSTRKEPRKVAVVDSPGVLCTDVGVCDEDRLVDQLSNIAAIYNTDGLHAMLLVISGRQRFTKEDRDTVQYLRAVFGDRLLQDYTIIIITGKDNIEADKKIRGDVETYLYNARTTGLQEVLSLCKHRVVFFNNKTKDETIQRMQLVELVRMIDDLVQKNGGPYIDENFKEGIAVAEACSMRNAQLSRSTPQLPTTGSNLADEQFPSEEGRFLQSNERHPGPPSQSRPLSTRAKSIPGLPIFDSDESCFFEEGILLPGMATASGEETFTGDELVSVRNKTGVSPLEEPRGAQGRSHESLEGPYRRVSGSASPLSQIETGQHVLGNYEDSNATEATEEKIRRSTAFSNKRWSRLWRAIRRKLRFKKKRYTVTGIPKADKGVSWA